MKKKIIKNSILTLVFIIGLIAVLGRVNFVLRNKELAGMQDKFVEMPKDSIDVVFIGTSHQFCSINPDILYEDYGIEAFMLASSAQTVPMSYYAAMEAIEYQHPEMIVFEVLYCTNDFRVLIPEMTHAFLDGMPVCEAKYLAINDLVDEGERLQYYLPLEIYHSRWKELTEKDYSFADRSDRGGVYQEEVEWNSTIQVISAEEKEPIPAEMEKYLDKMVALCKENDVELVMYVAPFNTLRDDDEFETAVLNTRQRMFNYLSDYAEENGLKYYNLFYEVDALGFDNETDWLDRQHLNCKGQEKLTRYMAEKGYFEFD